MGEIVFVGLGLHDDKGISLRGLEEVRTADSVFLELYTNLLPGFSLDRLKQVSGKRINVVSRRDLEEKNGKAVLDAGRSGKAVLLVPGDPLVATTHVALRIEAEKRRIRTRIVHGASILSAVIGLSGLHSYKFGKSVTIPFPDETPSDTPYAVIVQNRKLGLHTLCLLDIRTEQKRYLTIQIGLNALLQAARNKRKKELNMNALAIGIARAGSGSPTVKAGFIKDLLDYDFGLPPYSLIFPGKLHFVEAEALVALAGAPERLRMETE
jgi:diphthine synthase